MFRKLNYKQKTKLIGKVLKTSVVVLSFSIILWLFVYFLVIKNTNFAFVRLLASTLINLDIKPATVSGITKAGLKYYLTSNKLKNYISNFFDNDSIQLEGPSMVLSLLDGSTVTLKGRIGFFDDEDKKLHVAEGVVIESSVGYIVNVDTIVLDMDKSIVFSEDEVVIHYGDMVLYSTGFSIEEDLQKINLRGPVTINDSEE